MTCVVKMNIKNLRVFPLYSPCENRKRQQCTHIIQYSLVMWQEGTGDPGGIYWEYWEERKMVQYKVLVGKIWVLQ